MKAKELDLIPISKRPKTTRTTKIESWVWERHCAMHSLQTDEWRSQLAIFPSNTSLSQYGPNRATKHREPKPQEERLHKRTCLQQFY
eukprot:3435802-Amphidinium_carterae.1